MIYKNARFYSAPKDARIISEELEVAAFAPCTACQPESYGFVPPLEGTAELTLEANGTTLMCLQIQEKILPSSVIKKELAAAVAKREQEQSRKVFRKERLTLQDEIILDLLPKSFTKDKRVFGHLDRQKGLLVIDTASPKIAEMFIQRLRGAVGSMPVFLLDPEKSGPLILWSLVRDYQTSDTFEASLDARLISPDGTGTVAIKNEPLDSDEVQAYLEANWMPHEVRIAMSGGVAFTLTDKLALKRIVLSAELISGNSGDLEHDDKLTADYMLNVSTLREIYEEMASLFEIAEISKPAEAA